MLYIVHYQSYSIATFAKIFATLAVKRNLTAKNAREKTQRTQRLQIDNSQSIVYS